MIQKKIKILRIIARLNVGGPAVHTILLTDALNGGRFESTLVAGQVEKTEKDMLYFARQKKVIPIIIPELGRKIHPLRDLMALCKIYNLIRRERPFVVHTHTAKAGAIGRVAAILAGVPVRIHTFHGHIFEGYFNRFYVSAFLFVERVLALFTKYIIVVSEAQKNEIAERYKVAKPNKIRVIPLGLELERFFSIQMHNGKLRSKMNIREDFAVIGIIGRLVPVKNHRMFLDAVKQFSICSDTKVKAKFLVIGDGEERKQLEEYARILGIDGNVIFCGWREDMAEVYSDLDIVVLTSLNEGTPLVLIEALAAGRPVVATNVGGIGDVVEDGVNGYLVPSGDVNNFSHRLADLVGDPQKRHGFGLKGREIVRAKFSKERLIEDMERLYAEATYKLYCKR